MDPQVVLVLTFVFAGLVVAAYIWFVVWRFRVERRKKEAQAITDSAMSDAIAKTAQRLSPPSVVAPSQASATISTRVAASAPTAAEVRPAVTPTEATIAPTEATVAALLSGIALPHDLVPLTTLLPREGVGDRVAFWTDRAPAETVGPAFAGELERLGYTVIPLDERSLSAQREHDRVLVMIHPDGPKAIIGGALAFSSVPDMSVVIEVWVPA